MDVRAGRTPATGAVSSWASQFGSKAATQATAANQPAYGDALLGTGRPGLSFDGTDFLGGLNASATSTSRTVVALVSFTNAGDNRTIVGGSSNGDYGYRRNTARQMQVVASGAASLATDTVAIPDGAPTIVASRFTQATIADFRQNGRPTTNAVPGGNAIPPSATIQIGRAVTSQMMIGAIGSIVVADAYISDDDVLRVEGWLAHANGAAALLADGHPYRAAPPTVATAAGPLSGSASATLLPLTGASSGRVPSRGQGSGTLQALTGSASARAPVRGAAAGALGSLLGTSAATALARGSGSGLLDPLTSSAGAAVRVRAAATALLGALSGSSSGSASSPGPTTGSGSGLLAPIVGEADVRVSVLARAASLLGELISAARAGLPYRTPKERTAFPAREYRIIAMSSQARIVKATGTGATMLEWPTKDASDILDYAIDWTARLDGDEIVSATWTVPEGMTADRETASNAVTTIWLAGGPQGRIAHVTCRIVTRGGRQIDTTVRLPVTRR